MSRRRANPLFVRLRALAATVVLAAGAPAGQAAEDATASELVVTGAYAEMRTGPGRGYPVFHVVERGDGFRLLRRRTDWFLVETDGTRGWMHASAVGAARARDGARVAMPGVGTGDWHGRRFEAGFGTGDFDGDQVFVLRAGGRLGRHFVLEGSVGRVAGTFSSTTYYLAGLQVMPFPDSRLSPFFTIGGGWLENEPVATLVDAERVSDWAAQAGVGARAWVTRRFLVRGDFRRLVFTRDVNNTDAFREWTLGFSVFF